MTFLSRIFKRNSVLYSQNRADEERVARVESTMTFVETQLRLFQFEKERVGAAHKR